MLVTLPNVPPWDQPSAAEFQRTLRRNILHAYGLVHVYNLRIHPTTLFAHARNRRTTPFHVVIERDPGELQTLHGTILNRDVPTNHQEAYALDYLKDML